MFNRQPAHRIPDSPELTKNQIRLGQSAMANRDTNIADLCRELGISRATLYRYVGPAGQLRDHARRVLKVEPDTLPAASA